MVATPEISAIRDLSRSVDDLVNLPDTRDKVRVVLNRYSSQLAIGLDKVEKAIRMPVHSCISNNYVELVRSANLGEPVGVESKSAFSLEMQRWRMRWQERAIRRARRQRKSSRRHGGP